MLKLHLSSFENSKQPTLQDCFKKLQISSFADIKTTRRKYKCDDFTIDLDETNFGYYVGEVELMVESPSQANDASNRIVEFCKKFDLDISPTQGKVLQYLYMEKPNHYKALLDCGLINAKLKK